MPAWRSIGFDLIRAGMSADGLESDTPVDSVVNFLSDFQTST
jgi:hypothetical protein